jgi:serine O-acetyltransferase
MDQSFLKQIFRTHQECPGCPSLHEVADFYNSLLVFLFPDFATDKLSSAREFDTFFSLLKAKLGNLLHFHKGNGADAEAIAEAFFESLPVIYNKIGEDITAMFEGDPAAKTRNEVVRTYPGFYAIAAYRVAHQLHQLGVKEIPRMITEHAHSRTGIDIHPSARIGRQFCIDHGTGVVIGETTIIGDRVKLYQGVTLGALSVSKEDAERKRHPTIENDVIIYAGATILGGDTTIGSGTIVGGNVWLTRSVPENSRIYYQAKMYNGHTEETDLIIVKQDPPVI